MAVELLQVALFLHVLVVGTQGQTYEWNKWTAWSKCDAACPTTTGHETRTRHCVHHIGTATLTTSNTHCVNGTSVPTSEKSQTKSCTIDCSDYYIWGSWGSWSSCDATCSGLSGHASGHETRTRQCQHVVKGHANNTVSSHCSAIGGSSSDRNRCSKTCRVDGSWGLWSSWYACSVTMGTGASQRVRFCDSPRAQNGGSDCSGDGDETKACTLNVWSEWGSWGQCSASCDSGLTSRTRTCVNGDQCGSPYTEFHSCTVQPCVKDGAWSDWSSWTACSKSCSTGVTFHTRKCDNPAPSGGGNNCTGSRQELQACKLRECPIDGGWTNYTLGTCSVTCGIGVSFASRTCTEPVPQYGGKNCDGAAVEFQKCTQPLCIIDGEWTKWSELSTCDVICGPGLQRTVRTCSDPPPSNGGLNCSGESMLTRECDNGACGADFRFCNHTLLKAVIGTNHGSVDGSTPLCADPTDPNSSGIINAFCNAPDNSEWILGTKLLGNCGRIPLYMPIASEEPHAKTHKYGVMMDCYNDILTMAVMNCQGAISTEVVDLQQSDSIYHIMLWK